MISLIWREWRAHTHWATLAGALACLGFCLALSKDCIDGILNEGAQQVTCMLAPAWGMALALLQTIPQTTADRWSLLLHRPLSRSRIFLALMLAGMVLAVAPMLLAFLGAWFWTQLPGNIGSPQDPRMIGPGLADIGCGLVYYACGLVIGLRRARWARSRLLPMVLAITCSLLVTSAPSITWAAIEITSAGCIAYAAAFATFLSDGEDARLGWPQRFILSLMLLPSAVGAAALPLVLQLWLTPKDPVQLDYPVDRVLPDGTVERISQKLLDSSSVSMGMVYLSPLNFYKPNYRDYQAYVVPLRQNWTTDKRNIYYRRWQQDLLVYDYKSGRRLGYLTPSGIVGHSNLEPLQLISDTLPVLGDTIMSINESALIPIVHLEPNEHVLDASSQGGDDSRILVTTTQAIRVFSRHIQEVRLPRHDGKYARIGNLSNGHWVIIYNDGDGTGAESVVTTDEHGKVLSEYSLPALPTYQPSPKIILITAGFLPLAPAIPACVRLLAHWHNEGTAVVQIFVSSEVRVGLIAGTFASLALCGWLARRRGLGRASTLRWLMTTVVLNLAGPLLLLMVHPGRARMTCAECGTMRPVEAAACPRCGIRGIAIDPVAIILRPKLEVVGAQRKTIPLS